MEWMLVKHFGTKKEIGAIGFAGNKFVAVATFYADKDWDHSGKVEFKERFFSFFGLGGKAIAEVLAAAKSYPSIFMRDPGGLNKANGQAIVQFASSMIIDGLYTTYFKAGVSQSCGAIASKLVKKKAARFVVRKGMEKAVKAAYQASTR